MKTIERQMRHVAAAAYGPRGRWAYASFDVINERYFDGELSTPWIQWAITPHSACLGSTGVRRDAVPVITLHPSILGGTEKKDPWEVPARHLGRAYAFDVLVHELMHVAVVLHRGHVTKPGETSHNNPAWIAEVNRIAPLLGFGDLKAGRSRVVREGQRVFRACDGDVPFRAASGFPQSYRKHLNALGYYSQPDRHAHVPEFDRANRSRRPRRPTGAKTHR